MHVGVDIDVVPGVRADVGATKVIQAVGVVLSLFEGLFLGGKAIIRVGGLKVEDASSVLHVVCADGLASRFDVEWRVDRRFDGE